MWCVKDGWSSLPTQIEKKGKSEPFLQTFWMVNLLRLPTLHSCHFSCHGNSLTLSLGLSGLICQDELGVFPRQAELQHTHTHTHYECTLKDRESVRWAVMIRSTGLQGRNLIIYHVSIFFNWGRDNKQGYFPCRAEQNFKTKSVRAPMRK